VNASAPLLKLRTLDTQSPDFDAALESLIRFEAAQDPAIDAAVASIIADVRQRGDAAVLEYTARFDGIRAERMGELAIGCADMRRAYESIAQDERGALENAALPPGT
jgi:histidinol dehydrogenase